MRRVPDRSEHQQIICTRLSSDAGTFFPSFHLFFLSLLKRNNTRWQPGVWKQKAAEYDKQQEANKTELQKATERAEKAEKMIADMEKANSIRDIRSKISKETGVPEELLTADTEEDSKKLAEAINAYATPKDNLNVPDGGEAGGTHKQTTAEQFGEWFNQVTN